MGLVSLLQNYVLPPIGIIFVLLIVVAVLIAVGSSGLLLHSLVTAPPGSLGLSERQMLLIKALGGSSAVVVGGMSIAFLILRLSGP